MQKIKQIKAELEDNDEGLDYTMELSEIINDAIDKANSILPNDKKFFNYIKKMWIMRIKNWININ